MTLITISQTTPDPPLQSTGTEFLRVWYTANFVAGDGVTPVEGGNGQTGFYYDIECSQNGSGNVVIPAFTLQATTESNPTANMFGQLYVNGAADRMIFGGASGWQIPTVYGTTINYGMLALYNRAKRLVYAPSTYFTADETIREILLLAGVQNYAGVGILGRTQLDTAPDVASIPIAVGVNSPLLFNSEHLIPATNVLTPQLYGAFADGLAHLITAPDIAANPQWIGSYNVGDSWDSVGMQEAIYAALATLSTPGNVVWNYVAGNYKADRPVYWPNGSYYINRTIVTIATGFKFFGAGRKAVVLNWYGSTSQPMWSCNAVSYGSFGEMSLNDTVGTDQALLELDWTGVGTASLKTQQLMLANMDFTSGQLGDYPLRISKSGGSSQGDTILLPNCLFSGGLKAGLAIGFASAQNALGIQVIGGDIQGCLKDGILVVGGQIFVTGMSFQNQDSGVLSADNILLSQITQNGADFHSYAGAGVSAISSMKDIRSESDVLAIAVGGLQIDHAAINNTSSDQWVASSFYNLGQLIHGTPGVGQKGALGQTFMLVSFGASATAYATIGTLSTNAVISDPAASYGVNALVGLAIVVRYPNGFTEARIVASNTATTITTVTPFTFIPSPPPIQVCGYAQAFDCIQYRIAGISGATEPTWASAVKGVYNNGTGNPTVGGVAVAGSNVITCASATAFSLLGSAAAVIRNPAVGDYICLFGAGTNGGPFISRVTGFAAGPPALITVADNAATSTPDGAGGFISTPFTDGTVQWIDIPFGVITGATSVKNLYANGGKIWSANSVIDSIFQRPDFMWPLVEGYGSGTQLLPAMQTMHNCGYRPGDYNTNPLTLVPDFTIPGADVASANTIIPTGNSFTITGTTTIKTINPQNVSPGTWLWMTTTSAVTFDETGNLRINGVGTTLTTTAGDTVLAYWGGTTFQLIGINLAYPSPIGTGTPSSAALTTLSLTQREAFPPTAPAQLTGNVNDYNPGGNSTYLRLISSASWDITGLTFTVPQTDGEVHTIVNIGLANIVIKHQNVGSAAANRFYCSTAADITLLPKQAVDVLYDAANLYWLAYKRT